MAAYSMCTARKMYPIVVILLMWIVFILLYLDDNKYLVVLVFATISYLFTIQDHQTIYVIT